MPTQPPCLDDPEPADTLREDLAASLEAYGKLPPLVPTVLPGDGKVSVIVKVTKRTGRREPPGLWFRFADPSGYDPEHRTASVMAVDALTDPADRTLRHYLIAAQELHGDYAQALVLVNGRPLYDETLRDLWDTIQHGIDHPPAWDWTVTA